MLPRLTTNHLALLATLAETGTVGAAARRLGLTQSAASHRLREAERRAGAALVVRRANGVRLTDEGERLASFGTRFLSELARIEQDIDAGRGRTVVRLGQATYNRYHWLPPFLDHARTVAPDLDIDLYGGATQRPLASLLEGAVDVSTVYTRPRPSRRFKWRRLGPDPLVAVMAPDHPLAGADHVTSEMLSDARLYLYPFADEPGFEWEALLGPTTAPFRNLSVMPTPEAVVDLLRAGFGVSFFSRWAIQPELAAGALVARPIGDRGISLDWWAVTRADDDATSPAARLVACFLSWVESPGRGFATLGFDAS